MPTAWEISVYTIESVSLNNKRTAAWKRETRVSH